MEIEWAATVAVCFTLMVLIKLIRKSLTFPMFLEMELIPASCTSQDGNDPKPMMSIVLPAKDEGHCIKESASRILASNNCRFELILVNDRSQDNTLQLMEELARADARIKMMSVDELPVGWTGKTHAMFLGANIASGEILVFTDADSFLNPNALCTALSCMSSRSLDLLSLLPGFTKRGFIADAIFPILALGLLHYHPLKDVNNPVKPAAMASGSFLMITRKAYEIIGTWHRLRNEITEDIALAKTVKGQGMKLTVLRGSNLVQLEPFNNLLQLFSFWKRVYYGGHERSVSTMLRMTANNLALLTTYVLFGISSAFCLTQATLTITVLFLLTAVTVVIVSILQIAFIRREKGYWIYGLAAPLGFLMGAFVSLSALAALVFHTGIRWHGSRYK
ncbi:MAG: glycosyltransferase family 2 protein [Desulfomonilaceae bacterium]